MEVTVITVVPTETPLTVPFVTVATAESLLLHVTFWFVALAGVIASVRISVPLMRISMDDLLRITLVTAIDLSLTVTVQVAVLLPSSVVTVMVALPIDFAVTTPDDETVATDSSSLLHIIFLFITLAGVIVADKVSVEPIKIVVAVLFKITPLMETEETVTEQVAVLPPSMVVAVMIAFPADTAVITPIEDTVATDSSLLFHVTFLFVALEGVIVVKRVSEEPVLILVVDLLRETLVTGMITEIEKS
jgi:hypothetical protein